MSPSLSRREVQLALALLLGLGALAALVRPAWRRLDGRVAAVAAVTAALEADARLDPWGSPWAELSGVPTGPSPYREPARISAGPDRKLGEGGDDVFVGRWSADEQQRRATLDALRRQLPASYSHAAWLPVWCWVLVIGLVGADRQLRAGARLRIPRPLIAACVGAFAAVLGLLIAATLLRGDVEWLPFPARGWRLKPGLLPGLPDLLRPSLPVGAVAFGLLVTVALLLRARAAARARAEAGPGAVAAEPGPAEAPERLA